ncbi:MAG: 4Fe-4S dicluster domain-containing protein [Bacteroidales bacterium]|nr:4Fe-4S dicluster domain-containing protein [Bacteroidales bacterium]
MRKGRLKKLRILLSLLFFTVIAVLFLDFTGKVFSEATHAFLYLQFIPSVVQFVATLAPVALGFVVIIILTLLFGRIYCSTLCPLGTLQDLFSFMARKLSPRKTIYKFKKPLNWLRFGLMAVVILSLLTGSILLINLLDPYSAFGKIFHNLFSPIVVLINNIASKALTYANVYGLAPVKWVAVNKAALIVALVWSLGLLILSLKRGRLYCNTLCPVGAFLAIFARYSLFRIRLDKTACNSCGKCSAVCKAECINPKEQSVDFSRCVGCMNCLSPCPDGGVKFQPFWKKDEVKIAAYDPGKRKFLMETSVLLVASLDTTRFVFSKDEKKKETIPAPVPIFRLHPVTPPGALSQARFNSLCTACHLCVSACPTQVLQPTYFLYGLTGFLQPRMDYITSFCNFECTLCGEVCPTGAILPLQKDEKKLVQLGKSNFVKENCIVNTKNTACGACSEHCPTKAVNMVPYKDKLTIPEVNNKICVGCGACEYACPTDPKSIYVEGNQLHLVAEKPKEVKIEEKIDYKEEFPF